MGRAIRGRANWEEGLRADWDGGGPSEVGPASPSPDPVGLLATVGVIVTGYSSHYGVPVAGFLLLICL